MGVKAEVKCEHLYFDDMCEQPAQNTVNWENRSVLYAMENMREVKGMIKRWSKGACPEDIDDIFSDLVEYLARIDDFDEWRAYLANSDKPIQVDGFVGMNARFCAKRFNTERYKENAHHMSSIVGRNDGEVTDLLDVAIDYKASSDMDRIDYSLRDSLKIIRSKRIVGGVDAIAIIYIRLKSAVRQIPEESYMSLLDALGITKEQLKELQAVLKRDTDFVALIRALTMVEPEIALEELQKHVYGRANIDDALSALA